MAQSMDPKLKDLFDQVNIPIKNWESKKRYILHKYIEGCMFVENLRPHAKLGRRPFGVL